VEITWQYMWATLRMFRHLPLLGVKLIMNSLGHMGIDIAVQQEDVFSESLL